MEDMRNVRSRSMPSIEVASIVLSSHLNVFMVASRAALLISQVMTRG